jgi:uncharacterized FlaG/YvyC family protein
MSPKKAAPVEPRSTDQEREAPRPDEVKAALQAMGKKVTLGSRVAEFSYNSDLEMVVVKIYSGVHEPREVVRQIPPEDYLAFAARYRELLGLMFDEQA